MPRVRKQFCLRGHDTHTTGRYTGHGTCKQCVRDKANANYKKDPVTVNTRSKLWEKEHPKRVRERRKAYSNTHTDRVREIGRVHSWKKAGILNKDVIIFTQIDYDRLYQIQSGKYAICNRHQTDLEKRLVVDHDHKTALVRGLLCQKCNKGLGHFYDNPSVLKRAMSYLIRTGEK